MSSSKRKKVVLQCKSCDCFFLAKNFEEHLGANLTSTPRTSAVARMGSKCAFAQQSEIASASVNADVSNCKRTSFSESCIQMVEPKRGMMAMGQVMDKRDSFLPPEILGWQKYHAALVHPETLHQLECVPRSVAIVEICSSPPSSKPDPATADASSSGSMQAPSQAKLFTLWPCSEVPHMRVNLPSNGGELCAGNLVRVSVVSSFSTADSIVLVPSNLSGIPPHFLQQISNPSFYFSTYLKVYLSQAFAGPEFPVEVCYYGKKLVFHVQKVESSSEMQPIERAIENLQLESPALQIYQITYDAKFTICWEAEDLR